MPHHEAIDRVQRISLQDAKGLFDGQRAIFVDARSLEAYEQAHIPGAVAVPLREIHQRYADLPSNVRLVFY